MRILFESYYYPKNNAEVLEATKYLYPTSPGKAFLSLDRVGYFFNPVLNEGRGDIVFILPKVFLEEKENGNCRVFGRDPIELLTTDLKDWADCKKEEGKLEGAIIDSRKEIADFIFDFSIWIYRAIKVYEKRLNKKRQIGSGDNDVVFSSLDVSKNNDGINNTLMDILLAIHDYNQENQSFITFTIKNLHSGFSKINWTRSINHSTAFLQDDSPIYVDPVNKKRVINFDEELLIIFFSILKYMNERYCFKEKIPFGYELITGKKFESYLNGIGRTRLLRIKYKYFSDKAMKMWQLCYAFFDKQRSIGQKDKNQEYILVNSFHTVFEDMIDALIGDDNLPEGLKVHGDDKRIDHLYTYNDLVENQGHREIYYIGDSKYYPMGKGAVGHDAPKQFTYARNVIQWHLDIINGVKPNDISNKAKWRSDVEKFKLLPLYDELTEGFNIIPNFFISGIVDEKLNYDERGGGLKLAARPDQIPHQWQFFDKLFDRSSLFLSHYDINFLFVLKRYARLSNGNEIKSFKKCAHEKFRKHVINLLTKYFSLYRVNLPSDIDLIKFVRDHYYELHGRIFSFGVGTEKVLLYSEPIVEEIYKQIEDDAKECYNFESLIEGNKLLLDNKKIAVEVDKVGFGQDIERKEGIITYKTSNLSSILQDIQSKNPEIDILRAVEIIGKENIIQLTHKQHDSHYVYETEIEKKYLVAEEDIVSSVVKEKTLPLYGNSQHAPSVEKYYDEDFDESEKYIKYLPVTSVKAACGQFIDNDPMSIDYWIKAEDYGLKCGRDYVIVQAKGRSMEDKIHDGDLCVIQLSCAYFPGDIVLTAINDLDENYGGRFSIKKYDREKSIVDGEYTRTKVHLISLNRDYPDFEFTKDDDEAVGIVGVFRGVIG